MAKNHVLAIVLAGGEGKRLMPLTMDRAKPAVPFGGHYRLIDFSLSNMVNSGYMKIVVLTQYKSHSLDRHVTRTWYTSPLLGNFIAPVPAQQRRGPHWYLGSADAIYQSLNIVDDENPDYIVITGADNIYRMELLTDGPTPHRFPGFRDRRGNSPAHRSSIGPRGNRRQGWPRRSVR